MNQKGYELGLLNVSENKNQRSLSKESHVIRRINIDSAYFLGIFSSQLPLLSDLNFLEILQKISIIFFNVFMEAEE